MHLPHECTELGADELRRTEGGNIFKDAWEGVKYLYHRYVVEPAQEVIRNHMNGE